MSDTALEMNVHQQTRLRDVLTPRTALILGIALFSSATFYMVQPFFVIYFKQTLGFSTPESGLLVALPFIATILFGMIAGYVSDRIGVLRAYAIGLPVYGLSIGAIGFVHLFSVASVLMVVSGIAISVTSGGIQSILNVSALPEHRGLLQNYLYWIHNVGAVTGLLVSSELLRAGHSNLPIVLLGAVRIVMCVVVVAAFRVKNAASSSETAVNAEPSRSSMLTTLKVAITNPALLFMACSVFLLTVMESQLDATVPLYFTGHFRNGVALFGPLAALNAVIVVACQPIAVKLLTKRKPMPVFATGALCTGVGLALGGVLGTVWAWAAGMVLYSIGEVLWSLKLYALLAELPTQGNTALYYGTVGTAQNLAFFIGLTFGSLVYRTLNPPTLFGSMAVLAVIVIFTFFRSSAAHRRHAQTSQS